VADFVMVKHLLHSYEDESGDGEDNLQAFHAEFARTRRVLTPLRCRTTAQPADLGKNRKIQQGSGHGEADHGDAEGVRVEAVYHRASAGTEHERAEADGEAQTICRSEKCADALQKSKEEAGPCDCAWNADRIFPRRDRFSGARPNWSRRHGKTPGESFRSTRILHIDEGRVVTLNKKLFAVRTAWGIRLRMLQDA
jgi:hypothetical protein